jgi:hypothetical protein
VFNLIPNNQTTDIVATFVQSLAPLNSAANPFIFCLFSTNVGKYVRYKKSIKTNLCCRLCLMRVTAGGPGRKTLPPPPHACVLSMRVIYKIMNIRNNLKEKKISSY